jgi:hypothetical protein
MELKIKDSLVGVAKRSRILTGNMIKIIAAVLMVIDHVGVLFPSLGISLRIIGRISMPLFAFMISEGAKYTKNRFKYFGLIAALATACQLVYWFAMNDLYMSILVTFSISIILIYALRFLKWAYLSDEGNTASRVVSPILFAGLVTLAYFATVWLEIDYGFIGIITPLCASIPDLRGLKVSEKIRWVDNLYFRVLMMAIPMVIRCLIEGGIMWYSLLALPILLMYSGERGRLNMKYFFYIFYPLHLVVLEGIFILVYILSH